MIFFSYWHIASFLHKYRVNRWNNSFLFTDVSFVFLCSEIFDLSSVKSFVSIEEFFRKATLPEELDSVCEI